MKEFLDNVADFCSVYSLFILVVLLVDCVALIANLLLIRERGHGHCLPSERAIVSRAVYVFAIFLAVAAPVAAVAYYFGDGQTFMHYLQKYMDEVAPFPAPPPQQILPVAPTPKSRAPCLLSLPLQVADFITIVLAALCAALFASARFFPAFLKAIAEEALHRPSPAVNKARHMFIVTLVKTFLSVILCAYLASAVAAQFFTPAIIKWELGFLGSTKEYFTFPSSTAFL